MPAATDHRCSERGSTLFPPFVGSDGETRIPKQLPDRPAFETAAVPYLPLDGEFVPTAFVRDVLQSIAGDLLTSIDQAIILSEPGPQIGFRVVDASPSLPQPSVVLLLSFSDTDEVLAIPAHGLVWAATESPEFESLSSLLDEPPPSPSLDDDKAVESHHLVLPTYPVQIPHYEAWQPLHDFIYDQSSSHLLEYLLHAPRAHPPAVPQSPANQDLERNDNLDKLERIRQLWINAVALQIGDDDLWDTMSLAWTTLSERSVPHSQPP
ncbi:hypothetical protein B0A53_01963 [Rhodotorula sp. CCFEE 5036]|nr:hypothetical protein B0A53_01963 [Rhodotorula sp. CCFEE 5036]